MSAKPSGYGHMQIGGQERPYFVGISQADVFCRLRQMSIKEYNELFSLANIQNQALMPGDYADFAYSALVAGYEWDGLRVDFSQMQVRAWSGDPATTAEEVNKPLAEMINQVLERHRNAVERQKEGNAPAPKAKRGKAKKA